MTSCQNQQFFRDDLDEQNVDSESDEHYGHEPVAPSVDTTQDGRMGSDTLANETKDADTYPIAQQNHPEVRTVREKERYVDTDVVRSA